MLSYSGKGRLSVAGGVANGNLRVVAGASGGNVWEAKFTPDHWTAALRECTGSLGQVILIGDRERRGSGRVIVRSVSDSVIYLGANGPSPI